MRSIFEEMGGTYTLGADGMYYPNLALPEEEPHYGKYGRFTKADQLKSLAPKKGLSLRSKPFFHFLIISIQSHLHFQGQIHLPLFYLPMRHLRQVHSLMLHCCQPHKYWQHLRHRLL